MNLPKHLDNIEFKHCLRIASAISMNFGSIGITSFPGNSEDSSFNNFEIALASLIYKASIEDVADLLSESILAADCGDDWHIAFDYVEKVTSSGARRFIDLVVGEVA